METNFTHGQRLWAIDGLTFMVCPGDFVGYREDNKIALYNGFLDDTLVYDSNMVFDSETSANYEALKLKNEKLQMDYDVLREKYMMLLDEVSNYLKRS